MSDDLPQDDPGSEAPGEPWLPSPHLRGQLLTAVWATLAAAALSAASSVVAEQQGKVPGFTLADALEISALVPALWIVRTYLTLAREASSNSLRKSIRCLFGAVLLLHVHEV